MKAFQWYSRMLREQPYITNALSGTTIAMFGDFLAQTYFKEWATRPDVPMLQVPLQTGDTPEDLTALRVKHEAEFLATRRAAAVALYDVRRSCIFGSFTVLFGTPFWLFVYKKVDARFPKMITPWIAIQKGMVTWVLANSTTPLFIGYLSLMDALVIHKRRTWPQLQESLRAIPDKIARNMPTMMSYSICFWSIQWLPLFYFLKPEFRLLYVSFLQIVWSCISSYVLHGKEKVTIS